MSNNPMTDFNKLNDKQKDLHTVNIIKGLVMDGVRNANSCLLYTSPSPRD